MPFVNEYLLEKDIDLDTDVKYFPDEAIEATVLLTAIDLLKDMMALTGLEDEDAEIVQIITAQIQSLEASVNKEMEFLRPDLAGDVNNENKRNDRND